MISFQSYFNSLTCTGFQNRWSKVVLAGIQACYFRNVFLIPAWDCISVCLFFPRPLVHCSVSFKVKQWFYLQVSLEEVSLLEEHVALAIWGYLLCALQHCMVVSNSLHSCLGACCAMAMRPHATGSLDLLKYIRVESRSCPYILCSIIRHWWEKAYIFTILAHILHKFLERKTIIWKYINLSHKSVFHTLYSMFPQNWILMSSWFKRIQGERSTMNSLPVFQISPFPPIWGNKIPVYVSGKNNTLSSRNSSRQKITVNNCWMQNC